MTIRWGVLGTANIARGCTIPGMKIAKNCELYAVAGRNKDKAEMYQREFGFTKAYVGYDALLEDPMVRAVYIPLPNHLHKEWVIKALHAGKHVLCEKPLGLNAEDVKKRYKILTNVTRGGSVNLNNYSTIEYFKYNNSSNEYEFSIFITLNGFSALDQQITPEIYFNDSSTSSYKFCYNITNNVFTYFDKNTQMCMTS